MNSSKCAIKGYLREIVLEYADAETGEINIGEMAEDAIDHFSIVTMEKNDMVYELAVDVAAETDPDHEAHWEAEIRRAW